MSEIRLTPRGVLNLLEAAYECEGEDTEWLARVVRAGRDMWPLATGSSAYFVDLSDGFEASGYVGTGTLGGAGGRRRFDTWNRRTPLLIKRVGHRVVCGLQSKLQMPEGAAEDFERSRRAAGVPDMLGLCAIDVTGRGMTMVLSLPGVYTSLAPAARDVLERLSAHLAGVLRLRRQRAQLEAVLGVGGRVEHAEGAARTPSARERLTHAVKERERLRGTRVRSLAPDEVTAAWRAIEAGRWTVLEQLDSEGRRSYVALPNEPHLSPFGALSPRERQVIEGVRLGHSVELIAYELGITPPSVRALLRRALAKLGLPSRGALSEG